MDNVIEIKHIGKKYKEWVLKDISLSCSKGEWAAIYGSNGSGKTTLLEILSGSRKPDGGELVYFGRDPFKNRRLFSEYVGYVPQEDPLIKDVSVNDNIRLWFSGSKKELKELYTGGILKLMGLDGIKNKRVSTLSGGMKRRLSIALALINNPPILLLDEPVTALDIKYKADVRKILKGYIKSGGTVIMTTHDLRDRELATRVLLLKDGVLSDLDKEEEIYG